MGRWSTSQAYLFWIFIVGSLISVGVVGIDIYADGESHLVPYLLADAILIALAASLYMTRSRAVRHLQSSEERSRLLMEEASDAIFITDLSAVIVSVNRRATELTGYSRDELVGRSAQDLMPPGAVIDPDRMVAALKDGRAIMIETAVLTKNGTIVPVELSLTLVGDLLAQSIVRPIGERKIEEERLRQSEAVFRAVSELTSDYVYSMKVHADGSLTPEWLTGAYERVTGYSIEEAHEGPWQTLVHPDDVPAMSQALARFLRDGGSAQAEFRIVTKSGEIRHLRSWSRFERDSPEGPVIRIVGAVSDITVQKALEENLRESDKRFGDLYERLPVGVFRRSWDGIALEANPAMVELTGYPDRETFLKADASDFWVNPADRLDWIRVLEEQGVVTNYDAHFKKYDGTPFRARITAHRVRDDAGNIAYVEGVVVDISEEVALGEELTATVQSLRRADAERRRLLTHLVKAKEEERHRVASDIHDDSVQVMTAVAIDLERLARKIQDPERRRDLDDLEGRVRAAVGRLRTMVFELRPPTLDDEGIGSALGLYLEEFSIDTGIDYELKNELDHEPSNPTRVVLYRIAQEALTNVRKHSAASQVVVELGRNDSGITMSVTDDGKGFDMSAPDLVSPGHIGLSEMRERAEISGGRFDITSDLGRGTTVSVWVPELIA